MSARPTREQLAQAAYALEELAYSDQDMFHLIAAYLDKLLFVHSERQLARNAAGHKPDTTIGVIGTTGTSPVENQFTYGDAPGKSMHLRDPLVRALTQMRSRWYSQLAAQDANMEHDARETAGYPHRTHEEGWTVGAS
jgi:hypothetical protein